jgi:CRISPR-associated protein Cst2
MKNLKTQGFVLLDTDVAALNNSGKDTQSNYDNAVATKKITKGRSSHVYVSGQAWRYWWRQTLQKDHDWAMSPVERTKDVAFTEANPLKYADDDVFGYMRATKDQDTDPLTGEVKLDKKGKPAMVDATVTRVSPLKNSALISVGSVQTAHSWSVMSRMDGNPVPYVKEEYGTVLKGMFSIDLQQVGTFATYNRTGYKNLTASLQAKVLEEGGELVPDESMRNPKGEPQQLVRLPHIIRLHRVQDTLRALKTMSGGAMQTNNYTDVTPKFIVLATLQSGNHPFGHIVRSGGLFGGDVTFDKESLAEALRDYADQLTGTVYIGRRRGFMEEAFADLTEWAKDFPNVRLGSVVEAIEGYCQELEQWMP